MSATVTATELRSNVYRILDEVLDSGRAQEVLRKGRKLLIVPAEPKRRRLENLPRRKITTCSFDELVATSWEHTWEPDS
ncbi:MAG: type II toxin-antitoxin system Phd/YefM family antitoxin [Thermoanaerobaculia bacterium]